MNSNPLSTKSERTIAYYYLAKTAQRANEIEEALTAYRIVASSASNEEAAESRYQIAKIYYEQGKLNEAEQQAQVTNAESGAYPFWIAKSLLLMTDIYLARDDVFNARAAVEAVLENFKSDNEIILEAEQKLALVKAKESEVNRIKTAPEDGTLELDTTGGR